MSKWGMNILLGVVALVGGGVLYALFREHSFIAKPFAEIGWFLRVREAVEPYSCAILRFYAADFLWAFSLCCGLLIIYDPRIRGTILCGVTAFLCGVIWECAQWINVVSGTGDWLDVAMYLLASVAAVAVNIQKERKR